MKSNLIQTEVPQAQKRIQFGTIVAALVALGTGIWLLLRGVAFWLPSSMLPLPYPADSPSTAQGLALAATGCGMALLVCAVATLGRVRWSWSLLVLCAFATTVLTVLAWTLSGVADWAGMGVALAVTLCAAMPGVREPALSDPSAARRRGRRG